MNSKKVDFAGIQSEETSVDYTQSADIAQVKVQFMIVSHQDSDIRDATKAFLKDIEAFVGNYNK